MVLLNKAALSSFDFNAPMSLLFFQCVVCVALVQLSVLLGYIKIEPISLPIVRLWFPVNLIFVGMIFTSFFALKNLGVPMATVLKNLTNLFTIGGDFLLYRKVSYDPSQRPPEMFPSYRGAAKAAGLRKRNHSLAQVLLPEQI